MFCLSHDDSLSEAPEIDAKVRDGAVIIKTLKSTYGKTFRDFFINTFVPYISSLLRQVKRVGLVWDRYFAESLTNCSREKRGVGVRKKVTGNCFLPTSWMTFLRFSKNKAEWFPSLSNVAAKEIQDKVVVSTINKNLVTNGAGLEILSLMPYKMEEADERIFVHVKIASRKHAHAMITIVDSDLFVIAIANFHQLVTLNEFWIKFGPGKSLRFIPIHKIARSLGPDKSLGFLFFRMFSGCEMTS